MATFYISVNDDSSYDKIMEKLVSRSVFFSKDTSNGYISIEVQGNTEDYSVFKRMIDNKEIHAFIQEGI